MSPIFSLVVGLVLARQWEAPFRAITDLPLSLRAYHLLCRVTFLLPFGGFFVPLWEFIRRRLSAQMSGILLDQAEHSVVQESSLAQLPVGGGGRKRHREILHYRFSHLIAHLDELREHPRMFLILETTSFLKAQMEFFNGFTKSLEDVQVHAVPAAIRERDWNRFLHFMAIAINLQSTGDDFVELLGPLVREGHLEAPLDAVNLIVDPLERAAAKAVIATKLAPDSALFHRLLQGLPQELSRLPVPADPALAEAMGEKRFWTLIVIAQGFGLYVAEPLTKLIENWPEWNDPIWLSMAEFQLQRYGLTDSGFWQALQHIRDESLLKTSLLDALVAGGAISDPEEIVKLIDSRSNDRELSWACRFALLGRIASNSPDEAWNCWQRWSVDLPVFWSAEVTKRAAYFLKTLERERIDTLAKGVDDAEAMAALWVTALTQRKDDWIIGKAREATALLSPGPHQIHWSLLLAEVCGLDPTQLEGLSCLLQEFEHRVESDDLRRFLELVVNNQGETFKNEVQRILCAPEAGVDSVLQIASDSQNTALLAQLFENIDECLLPFALPESEGFLIWRELAKRVVPQLSALTGDLSFLSQAVELDTEKADDLREATIDALLKVGNLELAESVCQTVSSWQQRSLARLKL